MNIGEREYYMTRARRDARVAELNASGVKCRYKTWYGVLFNKAWTIDGAETMRAGQDVADQVYAELHSVEIKVDEATRIQHADLDPRAQEPTALIPTRGG